MLVGLCVLVATGFAPSGGLRPAPRPALLAQPPVLALRGGAADMNLAASYAAALTVRPILTKSLTACTVFAASDIVAQGISPPEEGRDWVRTIVSALVGLLYFGPAAHHWYEWVTKLFPAANLRSIVTKSAMGQLLFGPAFTCIFFAATLLSTRGLRGLATWPAKIKQDLLPTQLAGCGFWPFVDLVAYSSVPIMWIPLFVNGCSFVWTVFLSIQAARGVSD